MPKRSILMLAVLLSCFAFVESEAAFVKGPYIQNPTQTSIVIMWQSDAECEGTVNWGESDILGNTAASPAGELHEVKIEGLAPSQSYFYKVTCGGDQSEKYGFSSAPLKSEPFSFILFGDTRSNHDQHAEVVKALLKEKADLFLHTGDIVATGSNEEQWTKYFEIERELLANKPMIYAIGNHDAPGNAELYLRYLSLPKTEGDEGKTECYYAFDYGNTRFIILDTFTNLLFAANHQRGWFIEQMQAAYDDHSIRHVFIALHEGPYSIKEGRGGNFQLQSVLDKVEQYGIAAVVSGHDHHYWRGVNSKGLNFIVSGAGGAPLYDITINDKHGGEIYAYEKTLAYTLFEVDGDIVTATSKRTDGTVLDYFVWESVQAGSATDTETDGDGDGDGEEKSSETVKPADSRGDDCRKTTGNGSALILLICFAVAFRWFFGTSLYRADRKG